MLHSVIHQMTVSHETGSEANFGFGRVLMTSCLGMRPPKASSIFQFSDAAPITLINAMLNYAF